jgi:heptaprenylglyceryl phosphate synthase
MLDAAICRVFRQGPSARVTVDALRLLRRTLDVTANVIEAQHQSIAVGGSDAPTHEDSKDTAEAVSSQSSHPSSVLGR